MRSTTVSELGPDARVFRRVHGYRGGDIDLSTWPATVPVVAQVLREGSHGEGFLEILRTRVNQAGFYLMDEPDAPLSFVSCLSLLALLHDLARAGAQIVVATHSPIIAAIPGARLLELGDWGLRPASWQDLELVAQWREFLRQPQSFLRHLLDDSGPPLT